jgi:hypothetical protein
MLMKPYTDGLYYAKFNGHEYVAKSRVELMALCFRVKQ